jgi:hypothetical protein
MGEFHPERFLIRTCRDGFFIVIARIINIRIKQYAFLR